MKFRQRPSQCRAIKIALLPLMNPTTAPALCLGGMDIIMWTWSGLTCSSRSGTPSSVPVHGTRRQDSSAAIRTDSCGGNFVMNTTLILAFPFRVCQIFFCRHGCLFLTGFERAVYNMAPFLHCSTFNTMFARDTVAKVKLPESLSRAGGYQF